MPQVDLTLMGVFFKFLVLLFISSYLLFLILFFPYVSLLKIAHKKQQRVHLLSILIEKVLKNFKIITFINNLKFYQNIMVTVPISQGSEIISFFKEFIIILGLNNFSIIFCTIFYFFIFVAFYKIYTLLNFKIFSNNYIYMGILFIWASNLILFFLHLISKFYFLAVTQQLLILLFSISIIFWILLCFSFYYFTKITNYTFLFFSFSFSLWISYFILLNSCLLYYRISFAIFFISFLISLNYTNFSFTKYFNYVFLFSSFIFSILIALYILYTWNCTVPLRISFAIFFISFLISLNYTNFSFTKYFNYVFLFSSFIFSILIALYILYTWNCTVPLRISFAIFFISFLISLNYTNFSFTKYFNYVFLNSIFLNYKHKFLISY